MTIHSDILIYSIIGVAMLGMNVIPRKLERHPFSLPTLYMVLGILLALLPTEIVLPDPDDLPIHRAIIERVTEIIVIISLAAAGISIDRMFCWEKWKVGWRLLIIAMPLTITLIALTGWWALGLAPASALLLGSVLAPTDPVLAKDVQVEGPRKGKEDEVRFGLTLEASLNDGLAFPFVYLAITLASQGSMGDWIWKWAGVDFFMKIAIGIVVGLVIGHLLSKFFGKDKEGQSDAGVFVMGSIFLTYGLAELCYGYGFIAVFTAAFSARQVDRDGEHHVITHRFIDQAEKILLAVVLLGFGALLVTTLRYGISVSEVVFAAFMLLILRPAVAWLSLLGKTLPAREKLTISFFGIRGLGSIYYLAFALGQVEFSDSSQLWSITCLTIAGSILIHGLSVSPVMTILDRKSGDGSG